MEARIKDARPSRNRSSNPPAKPSDVQRVHNDALNVAPLEPKGQPKRGRKPVPNSTAQKAPTQKAPAQKAPTQKRRSAPEANPPAPEANPPETNSQDEPMTGPAPKKRRPKSRAPALIQDSRETGLDGGIKKSERPTVLPQSSKSIPLDCLPEANLSPPQNVTANGMEQQLPEQLIQPPNSIRTKPIPSPSRLQPETENQTTTADFILPTKSPEIRMPVLAVPSDLCPSIPANSLANQDVTTSLANDEDECKCSANRMYDHPIKMCSPRSATRTPAIEEDLESNSDIIVLSPGISIRSEYKGDRNSAPPLRFVSEQSPRMTPDYFTEEKRLDLETVSTSSSQMSSGSSQPSGVFRLDPYQNREHPSPSDAHIYEQSPTERFKTHGFESDHWSRKSYVQAQYAEYSRMTPGYQDQHAMPYLPQAYGTPYCSYPNTPHSQPESYYQNNVQDPTQPVRLGIITKANMSSLCNSSISPYNAQPTRPEPMQIPQIVVHYVNTPKRSTCVDAETQTMPLATNNEPTAEDRNNISFLENEIRSIEQNMLGNGHMPIEDYMQLYNTMPPSEDQVQNVFDSVLPPEPTMLPRSSGQRRLVREEVHNNRRPLTVIRIASHETIQKLTEADNVRVVYVSEKEFRTRDQLEGLCDRC